MNNLYHYTIGQRVTIEHRGQVLAEGVLTSIEDDAGSVQVNTEDYIRVRVERTMSPAWACLEYKLRRPDNLRHLCGWERRRKGRTIADNLTVRPI